MKQILPLSAAKTAIVTLAIGDGYLEAWEKSSMPSWIAYCEKNGIGLFVETDDLDFADVPKKKQWQKLLLGSTLERIHPDTKLICYIDTDVLINEYAPNIFESHKRGTVGLISQFKDLPLDRLHSLRRVAYFRRNYVSDNYPLDSALFMDNEALYRYQDLLPQEDFACSGVILFESGTASEFMAAMFKRYQMPLKSITDGGEEAHVNFELQSNFEINWLEYKFQALWLYEMAWKYPFLYLEQGDSELMAKCIRASLMGNYFLHFSGSWNEGDHWENPHIFESKEWNKILREFFEYLKTPVTGKPVGKILPKYKMKN
jgi:hypothetical protein